MKVEESLNVTFDETPSLTKTSPLEDDDLVEEEAIEFHKIKPLGNNLKDKSLENNEIINIKESKSHPLDNVTGDLNQRTLRSQAQDKNNFFCFLSTIEHINVNEALKDRSRVMALQEELNQFISNYVWELVPNPMDMAIIRTKWVYRKKLDENGVVTRNKARLVAQGLWYPKGSGIETIVYADFDNARDYADRKSTSGIWTFMGCCLTSRFSKKQAALAISTTEAEYVSTRKASTIFTIIPSSPSSPAVTTITISPYCRRPPLRGTTTSTPPPQQGTMSSPNHPTSDIEDALSLNFHDYFPATSGNNSPNSSYDFTKYLLATLVFSHLHDMEVMPTYDATDIELPIPLLQTIIAQPTSLPPSSVSPIMPPKRTSTSESPAMTQAAIKKLVADSVFIALVAQATNMANTDNTTRPRETHEARKCTYKEFMSCQPFYFNDTEGAIGLIHWFERTESAFSRSNCIEDCKVKFATGTLTYDALTWWNSYAKPIGIEKADKITWTELKRLLTNKCYPRTEVKKMEDEFYNLVVKENDLKTYIRRFQELALLCPNMVPNSEKLMKVFIGGLPRSIEGNVTASKP
nr:reverse transcriptase domain-containing protein [Tanacetum cinerariifolium]